MSAAFSDCWWTTLSRSQSMAKIVAWYRSGAVTFIVDTTRDSSSPNSSSSMIWLLKSQLGVDASMDFKPVIDQTSCFSQTVIINITPLRIHWLAQSWNSEQHFLQLETSWNLSSTTSIWFDEWRALNNVSHSRAPSIIISFHHPSRCENGLSFLTTIRFHHDCDALIFLGWNLMYVRSNRRSINTWSTWRHQSI